MIVIAPGAVCISQNLYIAYKADKKKKAAAGTDAKKPTIKLTPVKEVKEEKTSASGSEGMQ